ncbi:MAG: hypothetical protein QOG95_3415, partial [Mycobacterium sp.]|nr:hypothetical protein [Mycobacterium sp.]
MGDCVCDGLDSSESSVREGNGEVLGFLGEIWNEGVQSERIARQRQ